ncbi:hypothetical protein ACFUC1_20485 [Pedococcus sp. NPDC057267]|uniref:hypothetical protein n=1 Tax=Pedococcus sp. NPDC057267 TaxID=3346077 RepID=UPI0036367631
MSDARQHNDQPVNEWLMLQPPVWVPFAWWVLLVGSVIASMVGDPGAQCSVAAPCQPDSIFPIVVALVGVAVFTFWWEPMAALVAGLGYGALSFLFDPSVPGRYAGVVVACMSVAGVTVLRSLRAKQARVAEAAADGHSGASAVSAAGGHEARHGGWAAAAVPALGVVGLLLVAGSVLGYRAQTAGEQAHVERAERANAHVVTGVDDNYRQLFQLENGPRAGQRVSIEVTEELDEGSEWVVLLDPQDPTWSRLVSEPKGYTYWFGWMALGGFAVTWSLLHVLARGRAARQVHAPALHRVRITRGGHAGLELAGSSQPVGWVRLGVDHPSASTPGADAVALIRGPVSDGGWVSIEMDSARLPVVGPVRAVHRWRPLDVDIHVHPRLGALAGRTTVVGSSLRQVFFVAFGCFLLWFASGEVGPAWNAAHGRGAPGSLTVISVDCSGKGPCHHYGNFRSTDGRYSFTDVELIGDSATTGQSVPALYEGQGEPPDAVFAPGWTGLVEDALYLAVGLGMVLGPLGRLLGASALRRKPLTGRHARGRG